ncbi:hypothetical protein AVEN_167778-1 [Araneus ventricosus]|uniref:Uncharacterized protein n=1 Tax=Araneus ventricosus TaxID=182803 RepID=A0A4Y2RDQ8_ARAVE|nr:hypothetical protein AVEN_167778-1 [Araneus ventricosus]
MFWRFIAVVIRLAEQRVVEYRPKTHTQLQLPVGTVLRSLSSPIPLPSDHLQMFLQNVAAIAQTIGLLEQGSSLVQSRAAILIKIFCWFRKPAKRQKELHPFVQKG